MAGVCSSAVDSAFCTSCLVLHLMSCPAPHVLSCTSCCVLHLMSCPAPHVCPVLSPPATALTAPGFGAATTTAAIAPGFGFTPATTGKSCATHMLSHHHITAKLRVAAAATDIISPGNGLCSDVMGGTCFYMPSNCV